MKEKTKITKSSGNVFKDLGYKSPDEMYIKADLLSMIDDVIKARGLSVTEAARIIGVPHARISEILSGEHLGYSIGRLIRFLRALDVEVEIIVKDTQSKLTRSTLLAA